MGARALVGGLIDPRGVATHLREGRVRHPDQQLLSWSDLATTVLYTRVTSMGSKGRREPSGPGQMTRQRRDDNGPAVRRGDTIGQRSATARKSLPGAISLGAPEVAGAGFAGITAWRVMQTATDTFGGEHQTGRGQCGH